MKISHVRQPKGSYLCGQASLAMILGIDLASACSVMGHSRKTWTRHIVAALGPAAPEPRLTLARRDGSNLPGYCLLRARWGVTPCGHFAVHQEGQVHDPLLSGPVSLESWLRWLSAADGRLTSFLPLLDLPEVMTGTS